MNLSPKLRAAGYLLAAALAIGIVVWMESRTWRGVVELRRRTSNYTQDSQHLAGLLEARMLNLNDRVFRYSLEPDPDARVGIATESDEFKKWLTANKTTPASPEQRAILEKANDLLEAYLQHAAIYLDGKTANLAVQPWHKQKEKIVAEMVGLCRDLSRAERHALAQHLNMAQADVAALHGTLIASTVVMVAMGGLLGYLGYSGIIVPLRKRLQRSQLIIQRQEKLSSLGVLAAGIAHEIRNPLTSIRVRLFTQQALLKPGSEEHEDNVFLMGEIERLEYIVKDFLAFARPADPQFKSIKASQPMRELAPLLGPELKKNGIALKEEYLADPEVKVDVGQLKQVIINLVRNAAEAIGHDGSVTLRTRVEIGHRGARTASSAILEVADTGPGIPPDVQKRLFDPFFTTKASGTGLGLSIAVRMIEKHDGTLEFSTSPDQGTSFRIVLPIQHT